MKARKFKAGPVDCRLQPWIADDGTPFLAYATSMTLPVGIKIVGNGTIPHPLNVELSGAYAAAPELLSACKAMAVFFGTYNGDGSRAVLDKARAAIAKSERGDK